jgi:hypothetical protein
MVNLYDYTDSILRREELFIALFRKYSLLGLIWRHLTSFKRIIAGSVRFPLNQQSSLKLETQVELIISDRRLAYSSFDISP